MSGRFAIYSLEKFREGIRKKDLLMVEKLKWQVIESLRELQDDPDTFHANREADRLICIFLESLGFEDLVEEYKKVPKVYDELENLDKEDQKKGEQQSGSLPYTTPVKLINRKGVEI